MEKSNGQQFKEKYGYSKSQRRLMIRYGIPRNNTKDALEHLRNLQKQTRKKANKLRIAKHTKNVDWRRQNPRKAKLGKKQKHSDTKKAA